MPLSRLETLVPELQLMILDHITRYADLRNICSTSRSLRNVTTPVLYHTVSIDLESCALSKPTGAFTWNDPGIAHIRYVIFKDSAEEMVNSHAKQKYMFETLTALRGTTLQGLCFPDRLHLGITWTVLKIKQGDLRELEIVVSDSSLYWAFCPPDSSRGWLCKARKLVLKDFLDDWITLGSAASMLAMASSVEELRLEGSMEPDEPPSLGKIIAHSFRKGLATSVAAHLRILILEWLVMDDICLETLERLNCCSLTHLTIQDCWNVPRLVSKLAACLSKGGSRLRYLKLVTDETLDIATLQSVSCILNLSSGMTFISLLFRADPAEGPGLIWDSVKRHGRTLQHLGITISTPDEDRPVLIDTIAANAPELAKHFPILRNLCGNLPMLSMPISTSDSCSNGLTCIKQLACLPKLESFSTFNWPTIPASVLRGVAPAEHDRAEMKELMEVRYLRLLDRFALDSLKLIASIRTDCNLPPLRLLCFNESEFSPVDAENGRRLDLQNAYYSLIKHTDRSGYSLDHVRRVFGDEIDVLDTSYDECLQLHSCSIR